MTEESVAEAEARASHRDTVMERLMTAAALVAVLSVILLAPLG